MNIKLQNLYKAFIFALLVLASMVSNAQDFVVRDDMPLKPKAATGIVVLSVAFTGRAINAPSVIIKAAGDQNLRRVVPLGSYLNRFGTSSESTLSDAKGRVLALELIAGEYEISGIREAIALQLREPCNESNLRFQVRAGKIDYIGRVNAQIGRTGDKPSIAGIGLMRIPCVNAELTMSDQFETDIISLETQRGEKLPPLDNSALNLQLNPTAILLKNFEEKAAKGEVDAQIALLASYAGMPKVFSAYSDALPTAPDLKKMEVLLASVQKIQTAEAFFTVATIFDKNILSAIDRKILASNNSKAYEMYRNAADLGHRLAIERVIAVHRRALFDQPYDDQKAAFWISKLETAKSLRALGVGSIETKNKVETEASSSIELSDYSKFPIEDKAIQAIYASWLDKPYPRAFAVATNGAYGWANGPKNVSTTSQDHPVNRAMSNCMKRGGADCKLYAVDGKVVFKP